MAFPLHPQSIRDLWKEWGLRSLTLLSLFLQLALAIAGSWRKSVSKYRIQFFVWTTYLLADYVPFVTLGILSSRLANFKEMKGTFDPRSQITAFWAAFLLLHLGGPDTMTAFAMADNDLWLRQLARLGVKVGLAGYIYYMALSGSTLSLIAAGMILMGFIKCGEKILSLYMASKDRLQDSMRSLGNVGPVYPRRMELVFLRRNEGYLPSFDEVMEFSAPSSILESGQAWDNEKALVEAYELFRIFKVFFMGLIVNPGEVASCKRIFMELDMISLRAFRIVEIELRFMYDLLYTKVPLLNFTWGIFRWGISLSVPCAVLVLFSLQDKKDYPKADICITFLLVSGTILLEIYSLLVAFSSDWVHSWRLRKHKRRTFLKFFPKQRSCNYVAQFNLLRFSNRKGNRIFGKLPWLTSLDMKVEKNFYVVDKEFKDNFKEWILHQIRDMVRQLESIPKPKDPLVRSKSTLDYIRLEAGNVLARSNCGHLKWSTEGELDQSILIWHIATELCYYRDHAEKLAERPEDIVRSKMSKLVSRYMLYLLVLNPAMLPIGMGVVQYEDTLVDAQKFLEGKQAILSKWDEAEDQTGVSRCNKLHKSRRSQDCCNICHLLLKVKLPFPAQNMHRDKSTSVLFDACYLASKLDEVERKWNVRKWDVIGQVWGRMLLSAAYQSKGSEHCESLSRGGELLSHVWLLMAHLGLAQPEQTPEARRITKLITS